MIEEYAGSLRDALPAGMSTPSTRISSPATGMSMARVIEGGLARRPPATLVARGPAPGA